MRYEFKPEDLEVAKQAAKLLEERKYAKKTNWKLTDEQKKERLKFRYVRQLGEVAIARLSGAQYRGDRQIGLLKEPGDVGFVVVQSSVKISNELILTVKDHEQKRFKPFVYVSISLAHSNARVVGWELADRGFDIGERRPDNFGNTCWYLGEKLLQSPEDLLWLLGRWEAARVAWGFEPTIPQFCALALHHKMDKEVMILKRVYSDKVFENAVQQYLKSI